MSESQRRSPLPAGAIDFTQLVCSVERDYDDGHGLEVVSEGASGGVNPLVESNRRLTPPLAEL